MIDPYHMDARMVGSDLGKRKFKWHDAVAAYDGNIYGIPCVEGRVLRVRPGKEGSCFVERIGQDLSERKTQGWGTGELSHDGRIYCPPRRDTQVLRIDPADGK